MKNFDTEKKLELCQIFSRIFSHELLVSLLGVHLPSTGSLNDINVCKDYIFFQK